MFEDGQQAQEPARQEPRPKSSFRFAIFVLIVVAGAMLWQWVGPIEESAVAWGKDLPGAMKSAATADKKVLISFTSPACMYCRKMEREVFPQEAVLAEVNRFVPVKIDVTRDVEAGERYGVTSLPAYVVVDAQGAMIGLIDGYRPADQLIRFLKIAAESDPPSDDP